MINKNSRSNSKNSLRQLAKSFGAGVIFYKIYHKPKGFIEKCQQQGVVNMAIDYRGRVKMEKAAYLLPTVKVKDTTEPLDIFFLSGRKFWYQTVFCAYSMALHSEINLRPVVYDDGTLEKRYVEEIKRVFPEAKITFLNERKEHLEKYLPVAKFPYLRERHANYPNIRKLIDIHIGSSGWKLVLDSDMLFFQTPTFLLNWLKSPNKPCYMVDVETYYGYSHGLMESLAGSKIPERINVGICGLNSSEIDWEKLEFWCKTLIEKEGTSYYQEQALIAMLMAGKFCDIASEDDYIVMPDREKVFIPNGILHHYVAVSKPWYFRYGWQRALNGLTK